MLCSILTFNFVFLHAGLSFFSRVLENCEDEARFEQVSISPAISAASAANSRMFMRDTNTVDLRAVKHICTTNLISLSPREDVVKESLEESARSTVTKHISFSSTESY